MFNSFLTTIAKVISIPLVSILTFAGYDVSSSVPLQQKIDNVASKVATLDSNVKLGAYNWSGGGTYRLQSSIGTTDTTIKLSSFKEPISNTLYTMSYLNTSVAYGTLDPQQPTRSEFISFTGITQNADGTATLTGVTRGLSKSYPYTTSSTYKQTHSGQSIFILSDSPQHFAEFAVKANDEVITGTWTFNNFPITASTTYASDTVAGASELATGVEIASSTSVGGTTRRLTIPASLATSTYNSATAGLKVVVTQNSGKIDSNFISSDSGISPVGSVIAYSSTTAPAGWLLADGTAVSRTTYANLFAIIGTTYGVGDNSTTFNVPNLSSRLPVGVGTGTKVATFASRSSNVITVTGLTNAANNEFQTGQAVLYSAPSGAMTGLTHNTTYYIVKVSALTFSLASSLANAQNGTVISLSSDGTGTQTFTLTLTARTVGATGGEENHAMSSTELLAHTHSYDEIGVNTGTNFGGSIQGRDSGDSGTLIVNSNGGNVAMNIMNPYIVLQYIIKY